MTRNLLYKDSYVISEDISIRIPSVGEILECEDDYYTIVSIITSMPIDMMVQLDDAGIDYTKINEYELFLYLFGVLKSMDTSSVFGSLDLNSLAIARNEQNGTIALVDKETGRAIIDRAVHAKIADFLRKIHNLKKNMRKPANKEAQDYMIERARKKMKREAKRERASQLESLIIGMVNTAEFPYDFNGVRDISIYQFNESIQQVLHKVDYDNRMHGVYFGTVSVKDIRQEDLIWLTHK